MRSWIFSTGPFACMAEVSLLSVGCTSVTHQFITFTVRAQKGDAGQFFLLRANVDGLTLPHQPLVIHYRIAMNGSSILGSLNDATASTTRFRCLFIEYMYLFSNQGSSGSTAT